MRFTDYFTIFFITIGAIIMFLCVLKTMRLRALMMEGVNTKRWTWLGRLMMLFVAGYVGAVLLIVLGFPEPLLLITGLVFLLGSVFVYLVVHSAKSDLLKIHDINELLILRNRELQKSNLELDEFAYRTSHDLKAPISSMKGLIKVAQISSTMEEVNQCHKMMEERLSSLEELIGDILDLSKNARTDVNFVAVDLPKLIHHVVKNHADSTKRIKVTVEGPEELQVKTDPTRLKMVIGNLLSNAMHYSDITKDEPFVKITYVTNNDSFAITVADNGIGIDESHLKNIFKMFFRVSENSVGSGLGLYIVKETTERLKGKINVTSAKGVGSAFTVQFPL